MYGAIHSTAFHQDYYDLNNKKIQSGFFLFNTLRFGYQFEFFLNLLSHLLIGQSIPICLTHFKLKKINGLIISYLNQGYILGLTSDKIK